MWKNTFNLAHVFAATVESFANRPSFLTDDGFQTWRVTGDRVARLASGLAGLGIGRGDRIAVLARNSHRLEELKWAAFSLGAIVIPLNWRMAVPELCLLLDDCTPACLLFDKHNASVAGDPAIKKRIARGVALGLAADRNAPSTERLIESSLPGAAENPDPQDDAMIFYTGGTTGKSKGVRLSHGNILANILQTGARLAPKATDVYLHVSPMFHAAELLGAPWVLAGAAHVYLPAFEPKEVLKSIDKLKITAANVVPTILTRLIGEPDFSSYDLTSLNTVMFGSAAMTPEAIRRVLAGFPASVKFYQGYGLTETSPNVSMLEDHLLRAAVFDGVNPELIGSVGTPLPGVAIRIVDDQGDACAAGEVGEILIKGPLIMMGYLNQPKETAAAIHDGWFKTGDVGKIDAAGNLFILDRKKDMIISGGENVYSAEVESILAQHADIADVAVFGIPDDDLGEIVCAALICAAGRKARIDAAAAFCRGHIARYKVPRFFTVVEEFPRTAIGKVNKVALRTTFADRVALTAAAPDKPRNA